MHKRLIPQNNSKEQVDQDRYNTLVSKFDNNSVDDQEQSFKCVLKKVHKDYKQKINEQLKIESQNISISFRAELQCKSCNNFRLKTQEYVHHCYCGDEAYMSIIIKNLSIPVFLGWSRYKH